MQIEIQPGLKIFLPVEFNFYPTLTFTYQHKINHLHDFSSPVSEILAQRIVKLECIYS